MICHVQCSEQLIFRHQFARARQRFDERRFARVGVADNGDTGNVRAISIFTENGALIAHRSDFVSQFSLASEKNMVNL